MEAIKIKYKLGDVIFINKDSIVSINIKREIEDQKIIGYRLIVETINKGIIVSPVYSSFEEAYKELLLTEEI